MRDQPIVQDLKSWGKQMKDKKLAYDRHYKLQVLINSLNISWKLHAKSPTTDVKTVRRKGASEIKNKRSYKYLNVGFCCVLNFKKLYFIYLDSLRHLQYHHYRNNLYLFTCFMPRWVK